MAGMFTRFTHPTKQFMEDDYEDDWYYRACHHGYIPAHDCPECDAILEQEWYNDPCIGKICSTGELNMDRDYWINRPQFYDPFIEDTMYNCYFQWWQAHQWTQWCIV